MIAVLKGFIAKFDTGVRKLDDLEGTTPINTIVNCKSGARAAHHSLRTQITRNHSLQICVHTDKSSYLTSCPL